MDWFRLYHGTSADPKWRTISRRCGHPISAVLSVWLAMLECASQAEPRGCLSGWSDEDAATMLDLDETQVQSIRQAMQGKVLDGDTLTGWDRRQPKREDVSSTNRVRRYRERNAGRNDLKRDETQCNAEKRDETTDKIRGDKIDISSPSGEGAEAPPRNSFEKDYFADGKKLLGAKAGGILATLLKAHGGDHVKAYAVIADAEGAENPKEYVMGAIRSASQGDSRNGRAYYSSRSEPPRGAAAFAAILRDIQRDGRDGSYLDGTANDLEPSLDF